MNPLVGNRLFGTRVSTDMTIRYLSTAAASGVERGRPRWTHEIGL